jgi:hypothetical protein
MLQLIHLGYGRARDVVLVHDVRDAANPSLRTAAPDAAILVDSLTPRRQPGKPRDARRFALLGDGGLDGVLSCDDALLHARHAAGPFYPQRVVGVGFGAGALVLDAWINAGQMPDALVAIDGWTASKRAGAMEARRLFVEEARLGDRVLVLAHSQSEPEGKTSSKRVAELLTGWKLGDAGPIDNPSEQHEKGLVVVSYKLEEHELRVHEEVVAGHLLAVAMARLDDLGIKGRRPPVPMFAGDTLGLRALAAGLAECERVALEGPASRVQVYLAGCVRGGMLVDGNLHRPARLGLRSGRWSSAAIGWADHSAALPNEEPPPWRATVAERVDDARVLKRWHPAGNGYAFKSGDVAVFAEAGGEPEKGGPGHVARVLIAADGAGVFKTLDADEGGKGIWAIRDRSLSDGNLRGVIAYA